MASKSPEVRELSQWQRIWQPFWAVPATIALASIAVGVGLPLVDAQVSEYVPYVFGGGPDGARSVLTTVATAMISVTGLVFSITMVVLQLASSQFSPRVLGTFLQRRIVQVTLGIFTGSFLYSLTVLRSVRGQSDTIEMFVPQASVTLAYAYVVSAVLLFFAFIHAITTAVQASEVISRIGERTRREIRAIVPDEDDADATAPRPRRSPPRGFTTTPLTAGERHGYVDAIDSSALAAWAKDRDGQVHLEVSPGDFVVPGQQIGVVLSPAPPSDEELKGTRRFVRLSSERTFNGDFAFGVRQLLDIGERALSPGINDPTTAEQALNELHVILHALVVAPNPTPVIRDDDGVARGSYRAQCFEVEAQRVVGELAHHGANSRRVLRRLESMIDDLETAAMPAHRDAIKPLRQTLAAGTRTLTRARA